MCPFSATSFIILFLAMSTLFHNIAKFSCPDGFKLLPRKTMTTWNENPQFNLSWRRPLSYKNQSISKSMDWFLYDNGLRLERVNKKWAKQTDLHKIWNKLFNVMTEMHLVFLIKVTQYISGASWCYRLSSILPTIHSPYAF